MTDAAVEVVTAPRARDLGLRFPGESGPFGAITDVPGVEVGHTTVISGDDGPHAARTGVTTVLPRGRDVGVPAAAGIFSFNGNGELTGRNWIDEAGALAMPIAITNSHSVGAVHSGIDRWVAAHYPEVAAAWMLPVVGETWDGYLNDLNAQHVTAAHVAQALDTAASGPVAEGAVGGGTGMNCYGFKGGIGTASRVVPIGSERFTVGVLIQANYGSRDELEWNGIRLGAESKATNPFEGETWFAEDLARVRAEANGTAGSAVASAVGPRTAGAGSAIVIVATDAPLLPGQCQALARRIPLGLARSGTLTSHFSGDIGLAFSTANEGALTSTMDPAAPHIEQVRALAWGRIDPLYAAVIQAVHEAVWNCLVAARDMTGRSGHFSPAIPHDEVRAAAALRP